MIVKIRAIGNSQGILIPADVLDHWDVDVGDDVDMFFDGNRLVIVPAMEGPSFEEAAAEVFAEDRKIFEELLRR